MTGLPFAQPSSAGGDEFEPRQFNGRLLLIYPQAFLPSTPTKFGDSAAADVDLFVVDQQDPVTGQPVAALGARLFGNLAKSVRNDVGGVVLGRLGQVPTNNGNPAWVLNEYTPQDAQMAVPVDAAYKAGQFRQPAAPQGSTPTVSAPPAADPWAGMNATPTPPPQTGGWGNAPAASPPPAATPPAASVAQVDPELVAFLAANGVTVTPGMDQATAEAIARGLQSQPQAAPPAPPF